MVLSGLYPRQLASTMGKASINIMVMVPSATPSYNIGFGVLKFTIDGTAWHPDALLNSTDLSALASIPYRANGSRILSLRLLVS